MTLQKTISCYLFLVSMLLALAAHAELSESEQDTFSNESPVVRPLLERALALEKNTSALDSEWQAAVAYCEASRLGSAEAQYRLGMLYAFGKGVPEDRALAASLFSLASSQGHFEAHNMLETIQISTTQLRRSAFLQVCCQRKRMPVQGALTIILRHCQKKTLGSQFGRHPIWLVSG